MGLHASIFRDGYRCPLNLLEGFSEVTLVNVEGPFMPSTKAPPALLVRGNTPGTAKVIPAHFDGESHGFVPAPGWKMMGGAYVATSDSRFREAVEKIVGCTFYGAVPLHDRVES